MNDATSPEKDSARLDFTVESLETPALTKAQLAELLFDLYKPAQAVSGMTAHEKSLAVRLTLGRVTGTLTDEEIETAVKAVIARIASDLGGRLRA